MESRSSATAFWQFTGNNTYAGGTTISAGTLEAGNGAATSGTFLGTGTVSNSATLVFNEGSGGTATVAGVIGGAGQITEIGNGVVLWSNNKNTFTGNVTVLSGTMAITGGAGSTTGGSPLGEIGTGNTITVGSGATMVWESTQIDGDANTPSKFNLVINGELFDNVADSNMLGLTTTLGGGTLLGIGGSGYGMFVSPYATTSSTIASNGTNNSYIATTNQNGFAALQLAGSTNFNVTGGGNLVVSIPILNQGTNVNAANLVTMNSGAASYLIKTGSGDLVLTASNEYTGNTVISGGTLQLGNGGALGSLGTTTTAATNTITDNGVLILDNSTTLAQGTNLSGSGAISGTGGLVVSAGSVTLIGANTYSGGTTVGNGTLTLNAGAANGVIVGTLNINSGGVVRLAQVNALGYNNSAASSVMQVNINGGRLDSSANGNQGLYATFNLAGGSMTNSGGGGYQFDGNSTITTSAATVSSVIQNLNDQANGTLTFNVSQGSVGNGIDLLVNGVISQAASTTTSLTKTGGGLMELTAANTYTGATTISAGTLQLGNGVRRLASIAAASTIIDNGVLVFDNTTALVQGTNFSTAGISGSGSIVQISAGSLTLNAANSYTGGTILQAGTLVLGSGSALGATTSPLAVNAGLLNLNGNSATVGGLSGSSGTINNLNAAAVTLTVNNDNSSTTFSGTILSPSGAVNFVKAGAGVLYLNSPLNYSGSTTVAGGVLEFATTGSLYNGNTADWSPSLITAASNATFAVAVGGANQFTAAQATTLLSALDNVANNGIGLLPGSAFGIDTTGVGSLTFGGSIAGNIGITKLGTGALYLPANTANGYAGPTTVLNGQMVLQGSNSGAANNASSLVTVSNTVGGTSILSVWNAAALGTNNANNNGLPPVVLNASGSNSAAVLEIGAQLGYDATNGAAFSYALQPAGVTPGAGQISLSLAPSTAASAGAAAGFVGFSAWLNQAQATTTYQSVALYAPGSTTQLQTLQGGTYFPGGLTMGSPTANGTLVLLNPVDLNAPTGTAWQWSSTHGAGTTVPEGDYMGQIMNSNGGGTASVNSSFVGTGGLIFAAQNTYNVASLSLVGGAVYVGVSDLSATGATALGMGGATMQIGSSATIAGANLAFMTYGAGTSSGNSTPSIVTNQKLQVNAGNFNMVLGGFTPDYTAINGALTLNNSGVTFYVPTPGRVDFGGQISGSGAAVSIGVQTAALYVEGVGTNGINVYSYNGDNGTIAFGGSDSTGPLTVYSGRFLVNGTLATTGTVNVAGGGTIGGYGTINSPVNLVSNTDARGRHAQRFDGQPADAQRRRDLCGQRHDRLRLPEHGGQQRHSGAGAREQRRQRPGHPRRQVRGNDRDRGGHPGDGHLRPDQRSGRSQPGLLRGQRQAALDTSDLPGRAAVTTGAGYTNGLYVNSQGVLMMSISALYSVYWDPNNGTSTSAAWNYGANGKGNWQISGSGSSVTFLNNTDSVVFSDLAGTGTNTVTLNQGDVTPTNLVFSNSQSTYVLSGTNAIVGLTGLTDSGAGLVVILNTNKFSGPTLIGAGATLAVGQRPVGQRRRASLNTSGFTDNGSLVFNDVAPQTIAKPIVGSGSVTLQSGAVTMLAANSYAQTTINGGTLQLGNGQSGYDGTLSGGVLNNSAMLFDYATNETFGGQISGSGSLTTIGNCPADPDEHQHLYRSDHDLRRHAASSASGRRASTARWRATSPTTACWLFDYASNQTFGGMIGGSGSVRHAWAARC